MRQLREDERDEIEAAKYFIRYVNSSKDAPGFEVWHAMMKIKEIADKYVLSGIVSEEELNELIEVDDLKDVIEKLFMHLEKHLKEKENGELPRTEN